MFRYETVPFENLITIHLLSSCDKNYHIFDLAMMLSYTLLRSIQKLQNLLKFQNILNSVHFSMAGSWNGCLMQSMKSTP